MFVDGYYVNQNTMEESFINNVYIKVGFLELLPPLSQHFQKKKFNEFVTQTP